MTELSFLDHGKDSYETLKVGLWWRGEEGEGVRGGGGGGGAGKYGRS